MNANDIIEKCARVCEQAGEEIDEGSLTASRIASECADIIRALKSSLPAEGEVELAAQDASLGGTAFMQDGKRIDPAEVYSHPAETVSDAMVALRNIRRAIVEDTTALNDTLWMPDDVPGGKGASVIDYIDQTLEAAALAPAVDGWQPIESAPKDRPILAYCDHEADPYSLNDGKSLTLYAAHAEGMSHAETGCHIVEWGGAFSDSEDDGGAWLPDWWFVVGSEFEVAANPTHWRPLPAPPKDGGK